ncbi:MAG: site-specific DNA-methyltransferase [Desulfovibrio sp.]|uniref:site-specific DNA-methyltransferase n=1 Tax=Desulfovibrio sp. TaxID=885 RepID=UPI002A9194D6|nr:site-specific DNA-methyltransferase [Desulfovibrio sp.]MDY6234838.1 site-specific DNA-methyltransferase [Desulfovibrio sp.]
MARKASPLKTVETITHEADRRTNIPTVEYQSVMRQEELAPVRLSFQKRDPDLDPQLIWRGKYDGDDRLTVQAPPLYIQEKVHPRALVQELIRETKAARPQPQEQLSLFADFNGIAPDVDKTDFYQHDQNWTNRMILGDSLQVMASLSEREGLRGKVQCIYMDPPYGIKFNSNFQWSTTSRDVKDGKADNMTREPEQVKAFRDTWKDGIHSYLSYLRDRFLLARDLLTDSGSIFVQIGDENVHRVRALMDEVFGEDNFVSEIKFKTTGGHSSEYISSIFNSIIWYGKSKNIKYNQLYFLRVPGDDGATQYKYAEGINGIRASISWFEKNSQHPYKLFQPYPLVSMGTSRFDTPVIYRKKYFSPTTGRHWSVKSEGTERIIRTDRIYAQGANLRFVYYLDDFPVTPITNIWTDTQTSGFNSERIYVVQTLTKVIERCILMATDPGDLVLDPTCGSGTTAYVAEQWGRRWITIDTSRVALALARARIMGARYPYYLMTDSPEGQAKEAELNGRGPSTAPTFNNIRLGFVYERVPHITLKSIANNAEIDVIYEKWQRTLEPLRATLNAQLGEQWEEWEIPREADTAWSTKARDTHARWWQARIARQQEIDASIAARADYEFLYDKPYEDKKKVRVAGPFTVESLSPHRMLAVGADGELLDPAAPHEGADGRDFVGMILENLKVAGVQQAHKDDKIDFTSLTPWPGAMICAEGRYNEGETERRAGIFIGPEFGTVSRQDLVQAVREAADAGFDVVVACAFNYDAHAAEFSKLGKIPVLKARMNADLHMSEDLKNNGKGNLFVIFGEPDISLLPETDAKGRETGMLRVKVNGVDVFKPSTGEICSGEADDIACWFVDTDYDEESFFVRQAYFLGANDPYKALKTTLKAEIDKDAWESLHSDTSRPFPRPEGGRIAVKVINHLGDEVMKVFRV